MMAGALVRGIVIAAAILASSSAAHAALVGTAEPTLMQAPGKALIVPAAAPAVAAPFGPPGVDVAAAPATRSAAPVPLPPALLLLGTVIASLLSLRTFRRGA